MNGHSYIRQLLFPRNWPVLLVAVLFYSPVSMNFMQVGGKPIDFVFSDLVCVALCCFYITRMFFRTISKSEFQNFTIILFTVLFLFYLASLGFVETGGVVTFFTFAKYAKVFLAIIAGMGLARLYNIEDFWKLSVSAAGVVIGLLLYSQVVIKGSFYPRWGETYLGLDVYGFPNSPASYYIILFMYIITALLIQRRVIYALLVSLAGAFMVLSLSRSAMIVLLMFIMTFFAVGTSLKKALQALFLLCVVVAGMFVFLQHSNSLEVAQDALIGRYNRTFKHDDGSSGRFEIVMETLDLIYQRPLTGYLFDSFDNYHHGHSTPHNQYLEALFKTGISGFIVYFYVIFVFLRVITNRMKFGTLTLIERSFANGFMCVFFALSIGNFTQPNFTYSQTGNVVFLTLGFLAYARTRNESFPSVRTIN